VVPWRERADHVADLVDRDRLFDGQRERLHGDLGAGFDVVDAVGEWDVVNQSTPRWPSYLTTRWSPPIRRS
jgi:hypothetical protein